MDAAAAAGASASAPVAAAAAKSGEGAQPRARALRSRGKGGAKSVHAKNGEKKRNGDVDSAERGDRKASRGAADDDGAATQPLKVNKEGGNGGVSSSREKKQQQKTTYKKKEQRPAASADPQPPHEGKKPREESSATQKPYEQVADSTPSSPLLQASSSSAGDAERRNLSEPKNPKPNQNAESEHEKEKDTPLKKPTATTGSARKERGRKKQQEEKEDNESKKAALTELYGKDLPTPAHFREAEWFTASESDLRFAQWLFGRSQGIADLNTVQDAVVLKRMHRLYCLEKKIQQELQNRANTITADDGGDGAENDDESTDALDGDDDEANASANHDSDENVLWTASAIVADVRDALRVSRYEILKREEERKSSSEPKQKQRSLEQSLVKELIENTTELLLNRASFEDIAVLESWMAFLNQDAKELGNELGHVKPPESTESPEVQEPDSVIDAASNDNEKESSAKLPKRELKRQQKQRQSGKNPDAAACEQLRTCIDFLKECHQVAEQVQGSSSDEKLQPPTESPVADLLVNELNRIYLKQRINEFDEARRIRLTQDMQQLFRKKMDKWRKCKMILFGSSLSLYGSISSDLDMCLIANPSGSSNNARPDSDKTEVTGRRELRSMLNGKTSANSSSPGGGDAAMDMVALQELLFQVKKSIEKITMIYHDLTKDKTSSESRGQLKQMQQLRFFRAHFKLLQDAINDRVAAIGNDDGGEAAAAVAKAAATRIKEIVAKSRRQSDDMFRVKAMLERSSCQVRMVISGARIPIIRFQHLPTKLECDMCFENVLATRNTFLLRAYAAFDERARVLGMAIKHWVKQRAINDASMGFLSSYSYVLLTVYFLQVAAGVLPNLQDPELLAEANVAPDYYNGVNIAFCVDKAAAQRFYDKTKKTTISSNYSLSMLLVWFFEFYATKFDFARRVIAIRSPDMPIDKRVRWGAQKAKSWRISIQDPLETGRDLGCVLQFKGQEKILQEFKRGYEMLRDGKSFADVAGEPALVSDDAPQNQKGGKKDSKGKTKGESRAPYSLTLWSQDVNLGKADIQRLLKSIDSSIRVGVIEKMVEPETDMRLKKWRVELLMSKGPAGKCPRALKLKSRVDFVSQVKTTGTETVDVTNCVMWLHHHAVFQHAPCFKCCSPEHPVHECTTSSDNAHAAPSSTGAVHPNTHTLRVVIADAQKQKHAREERKPRPRANKENVDTGDLQAKSENNGQAEYPVANLDVKKPPRTKNDRNSGATRKSRVSDASPSVSRKVEVAVVVAEAI